MNRLLDTSLDFIKIVSGEEPRAAASNRDSNPLHTAADLHAPKIEVAIRYAFAMGRKSLGKTTPNADAAAKAVKLALTKVLRPTLLKAMIAGGEAGVEMLRKLRTASHKFASTQVNLPADLAAEIVAFGKKLIPDDDLAEDGRELQQHITVKYGLIDPLSEDIVAALEGETPASVILGKTALFGGVEGGTADAVTLAVTSECMHRLNKKIADAVETVNTQSFYQPHVTIAYVKKGLGLKYIGDATFEGRALVFDKVILSTKDDEVIEIPLGLKTLGDLPGHPFHGNQWTEGEGSSTVDLFKRNPGLARYESLPVVRGGKPSVGHPEAEVRAGKIFLYPKFDALPPDVQDFVFAHEIGHAVLDEHGLSTFVADAEKLGIDVWGSLPFDQSNMHEAFADTFASLYTTHDVESRYPQWAALVKQVEASGRRGLEDFRTAKNTAAKKIGLAQMRFDAKNERAADWADRHATELINNITETTRENIANAVAAAQEDGDLREQYDEILAAVGDPIRAQLIARTESMMAANAGQREGWAQAVDEGLLTGDEQREWIATSDACKICEALDGQLADLGGEYPDEGGEGPPLHPNCRCTEGISAQMRQEE